MAARVSQEIRSYVRKSRERKGDVGVGSETDKFKVKAEQTSSSPSFLLLRRVYDKGVDVAC